MTEGIVYAIAFLCLINSLIALKLCLIISEHDKNIETYLERILSQMRHH